MRDAVLGRAIANGIESLVLPPLPLARSIIILADNDVNGRGQRAANVAAARWIAAGHRVRIAIPPQPGTDFNDVLVGRTYAEAHNATA